MTKHFIVNIFMAKRNKQNNDSFLMKESVETKPLEQNDVLLLDFLEPCIRVIPSTEFEDFLAAEDIEAIKAIRQSILDHSDRKENDPVYVYNGFTALMVSDFIKQPIQASNGVNKDTIQLSLELFSLYTNYDQPVEILNLHSGEIFKFVDLLSAINNLNHGLYDLIKLEINDDFDCATEEYCFPVVNEKWIYRPCNHPVEWSEYMEYSINGND